MRTSVERKNYHSEDQLNNASQNSNKEQGDEDQRNAAAEGVGGKAPQRRLNRTEGKFSDFKVRISTPTLRLIEGTHVFL